MNIEIGKVFDAVKFDFDRAQGALERKGMAINRLEALCTAVDNLENLIPDAAYQRLVSSVASVLGAVLQSSLDMYKEIGLPEPVGKVAA